MDTTFETDANPQALPDAPRENAVLQTHSEWKSAIDQALRLGLPLHQEPAKNWDSLAALSSILSRTHHDARVLDAGAELYSVILPWLFLYGYEHLHAANLSFTSSTKLGPIRYERGDITHTRFEDRSFDAVTCLSVIEHGVDLRCYFKEMARILKPGGIVVTSTDYWHAPVETRGLEAYGVPIRVFRREEIEEGLNIASEFGLHLTGPLNLACAEKTVQWKKYDLEYTFVVFTLKAQGAVR